MPALFKVIKVLVCRNCWQAFTAPLPVFELLLLALVELLRHVQENLVSTQEFTIVYAWLYGDAWPWLVDPWPFQKDHR